MSRNSDIFSEPYAIVFAGGGARGAWQIGVWKALREKFGGKHAEAVSGTSVGALNAALYAMSPEDPTPAENIWKKSIHKPPIIEPLPEIINPEWTDIINNLYTGVGAFGCFVVDLLIQSKKITCRPNKNLRLVIQEGIKGKTFKLPTYICAYNREKNRPHYELINTCNDDAKRCDWLLASTAIPFIFPNIKIDGVSYSDGGFGWDHALRVKKKDLACLKNVPLKPIEKHENIKNIIKNIFVLTLSQNEETFWQKANSDFNIIPIMPSSDLGKPLDFSEDHIKKIMERGEKDGTEWLKNYEKLITNTTTLSHVHKTRNKIKDFTVKFKEIKRLRKKLLDNYQEEFEEALKNYKKNPTPGNEKKLNDCTLLQFSNKDISNMRGLINSDIFGDDGVTGIENQLKEFDFECEYEFSRENAINVISRVESSEKHELSSKIKDFLAYIRNRKMISKLPEEKKKKLKSILDQIANIYGILGDHELELAISKLEGLEENIEKLVGKFEDKVERAKMRAEFAQSQSKNTQKKTLPHCLKPSLDPNQPFVGRVDKLAELDSAIKANRDKAILLYGYPGNGKKQLALEYAGRHQEEFSGGCFVIDAKGKKDFAEVLRSLLERSVIRDYWDLQRDDIEDSDMTGTVNDKLKDDPRKKLIVVTHIDIKLLHEKMFNSLPDKNITVLVTSERIFNHRKIIPIEVPGLSDKDSETLLKEHGVNDKMIPKIIEKCKGNPWALNIVGQICDEINAQMPGDFGDDAYWGQKSGEIEKSVWNKFCSEIIKPVYERLSEEGKRYLMYATLLSYGKISGRWLSEIHKEQNWQEAVSQLMRCSLIDDVSSSEDKDKKIRWYEMLGNTREAVFQIADQNELQRCAEKLCKHIAENEMKNHTFSQEETLTLAKCFCELSREPWKQKILPLLFSLSMHDDLGDYLSEYKMFDWRRKVCEAAEKIIDSMENGESKSKYRASCLIYRGHINFDCGKLDDALACYKESHEIRQKIFHDDNVVFLPLEYQATVHARKRNLDEAENIFKECESKFESYWDKEKDAQRDVRTACETLARLYKRWADALSENEKKQEAEEKYKQAIDCAEKASDTEKTGSVASILLGRFQRDLGVFYKKENEVEKAIECLEDSCETLGSLPESENNPDIKDNQKDLAELKSRKEKETL